MTGWVEQDTVFRALCPPFGPPEKVMAMPSCDLGDLLVTDRTETVLLFP
jgi:hypothetical protein